jgi:hypothetical protein
MYSRICHDANVTLGRRAIQWAPLKALHLFMGRGVLVWLPYASRHVTTGDVIGSVTDISGVAIPNASVKITNRETQAVRHSVAGQDATHAITQLQPEYSLRPGGAC